MITLFLLFVIVPIHARTEVARLRPDSQQSPQLSVIPHRLVCRRTGLGTARLRTATMVAPVVLIVLVAVAARSAVLRNSAEWPSSGGGGGTVSCRPSATTLALTLALLFSFVLELLLLFFQLGFAFNVVVETHTCWSTRTPSTRTAATIFPTFLLHPIFVLTISIIVLVTTISFPLTEALVFALESQLLAHKLGKDNRRQILP
mmetsp:Transcript_16446/g.27792  ORF Transcript_16446/g.27792 Transcript_16446/m.27792 type:complete len:203 (-) Transcript_16446:82-690(-)